MDCRTAVTWDRQVNSCTHKLAKCPKHAKYANFHVNAKYANKQDITSTFTGYICTIQGHSNDSTRLSKVERRPSNFRSLSGLRYVESNLALISLHTREMCPLFVRAKPSLMDLRRFLAVQHPLAPRTLQSPRHSWQYVFGI